MGDPYIWNCYHVIRDLWVPSPPDVLIKAGALIHCSINLGSSYDGKIYGFFWDSNEVEETLDSFD